MPNSFGHMSQPTPPVTLCFALATGTPPRRGYEGMPHHWPCMPVTWRVELCETGWRCRACPPKLCSHFAKCEPALGQGRGFQDCLNTYLRLGETPRPTCLLCLAAPRSVALQLARLSRAWRARLPPSRVRSSGHALSRGSAERRPPACAVALGLERRRRSDG